MSSKAELSTHPNPVYDKINLSFNDNTSQVISTEIYDVDQLKVYTARGYKLIFNLPELKAGVYILLLRTKTVNKQFILLKK